MFLRFVIFLKVLLVPFRDKPPTFAQEKAFMDFEDERGIAGYYPSPAERYQDAVAWRDGMIELSLWTLLRWRLAVAWMPFCKGEQRLLGEWLSGKIFPNLWAAREKVRA